MPLKRCVAMPLLAWSAWRPWCATSFSSPRLLPPLCTEITQEESQAIDGAHLLHLNAFCLVVEPLRCVCSSPMLHGEKPAALMLPPMHAQTEKQLEVVYSKDFALIMLERKLARQLGHRSEDEMVELHERVAQMTGSLEGTLAEVSLLQGQLRHVEDNLGEPVHLVDELCAFACAISTPMTYADSGLARAICSALPLHDLLAWKHHGRAGASTLTVRSCVCSAHPASESAAAD